MLSKLRLWLHQFNLLSVWREERRLDREAKLVMVEELCSTLREQSQVATKALELSFQFLKNFETQDEPTSYVVREEDEVRNALERAGIDPNQIDPDDHPFSYY